MIVTFAARCVIAMLSLLNPRHVCRRMLVGAVGIRDESRANRRCPGSASGVHDPGRMQCFGGEMGRTDAREIADPRTQRPRGGRGTALP